MRPHGGSPDNDVTRSGVVGTERRPEGRGAAELRPVTIEPGFMRTATGSALIACGGTRVICTRRDRGRRAALARGQRQGLADGRVRDAARVDR